MTDNYTYLLQLNESLGLGYDKDTIMRMASNWDRQGGQSMDEVIEGVKQERRLREELAAKRNKNLKK